MEVSSRYNVKTIMQFKNQFLIFIFTDVLTISLKTAFSQKVIVFPCKDLQAIAWVRDVTHCDRYYICHYGSPLMMPACPRFQVWSNSALNCVPVGSRWDDCSLKTKIQHRERVQDSKRSKEMQFYRKDKFEIRLRSRPQSNKKPTNSFDWHQYWKTRFPTIKPLLTLKNSTVFWVTGKEARENNGQEFGQENSPPTSTVIKMKAGWRKGSRKSPGRYSTTESILKNHNNYNLCLDNPGALLPHPTNCHWYYNCSLANFDDTSTNYEDVDELNNQDGIRNRPVHLRPFRVHRAGVFVWECRYPQLFDEVTYTCREFINVNCRSRFEPVDQCEYSQRTCTHDRRCDDSCERRFGKCRGKDDGIYPIQPRGWSSMFMTCYKNRNIAQDKCQPATPIFSPERLDCVSLLQVPKEHGGILPACSNRLDGYYPDEQGRCAIFFRCSFGQFRGFDECPPDTVFDPSIPACLPYSHASLPCGAGEAPACEDKTDGLYGDPFGRCTHFFHCLGNVFQRYYSCDDGMFDPLTQTCSASVAQIPRPCGLKPSPCETLPTGLYPDQDTGCKNFIHCHKGILISNGTCGHGLVFSAISGRCDARENTPPPCGVSNTCQDRRDGRYQAPNRGCSFYYQCYRGQLVSLQRCSPSEGGVFFNPATGQCDYPQNICPPCGHRWWGCVNQYRLGELPFFGNRALLT